MSFLEARLKPLELSMTQNEQHFTVLDIVTSDVDQSLGYAICEKDDGLAPFVVQLPKPWPSRDELCSYLRLVKQDPLEHTNPCISVKLSEDGCIPKAA